MKQTMACFSEFLVAESQTSAESQIHLLPWWRTSQFNTQAYLHSAHNDTLTFLPILAVCSNYCISSLLLSLLPKGIPFSEVL